MTAVNPTPGGVSRRRLLSRGSLAIGGAAVAGAALGAGVGAGVGRSRAPGGEGAPPSAGLGTATEPFFGEHQSGIETAPQASAAFLALDLSEGVGREAIARLMRLLTDDAARLTQGKPALADTEPELAALPARLTVTFGFGPGLFRSAGLPHLCPVSQLPGFRVDQLEERWCGGDLLVQICADDPVTVTHALRMIVKDARPFASVRWVQQGFRRAAGVAPSGATQRNLMGQLDGTVNPAPGTAAFAAAVWGVDGPPWLRGGTTMVVRRIRIELETWDAVDRAGKEFAVGRRLDDGAPLTGTAEHDPPDFDALNERGFPVISEFAHIRRAHVADERLRILRRPYNYDGPPGPDGQPDSGLIFVSFQADVDRQFLPIQRRLDEMDLLNEWTTPVGSAVFAIPPGCAEGGFIGETLLGDRWL